MLDIAIAGFQRNYDSWHINIASEFILNLLFTGGMARSLLRVTRGHGLFEPSLVDLISTISKVKTALTIGISYTLNKTTRVHAHA